MPVPIYMAYTSPHNFLSQLQGFWPCLTALIFCFTIIIKILRSYEKSKKPKLPPGPKPWPIVGQLAEMLTNKPVPQWIHKLMEEMNTEIACIRLGNVYVIPVTCPAIAREFLRKNDVVFASRPKTIATEMASMGYRTTALVPYGEQWKKMKKILINDLLSPKKHEWLQGKRNDEADNLMFYVYNKCETAGGLVNVRTAARHYGGNVTRKLVFGTRYFGEGQKDGGPGSEETEHVDAIFSILKYIYAFCISDYVPCLRGLDLDGHESKMREAVSVMNKYHDPIIEERIKQWNDGLKTQNQDLLDVLISLKDANNNPLLTIDDIKAQLIELMIEAVDNPSNAVEWALAEMINQPQLLQKAIEELDKVVGKHRLVEESDIPKLRFVKACAREAFRLHPIAPFNVPHVSMNDTIVGNYMIPKGSHVLLSRKGLGRNPKVWNEPLKFKPERHLENDKCDVVLTEPDLRFISFSTGRRGCPGVTLGTTMTVMLLARLLHGFTWSAPPNMSSINLVESHDEMFLAEPLVAIAKPRLATELYR